MFLPTELWLSTLLFLPTIYSAPVSPKSHDTFLGVQGLTHLSKDWSSYALNDPAEKFFHESIFSSHYDGRFADEELSHLAQRFHLRLLLKSYAETMRNIGVQTWLMHGCLLGWWWNGRIMPWDSDIDVMVDEPGMAKLGGWWNMTVHSFTGQELGADPDMDDEVGKIIIVDEHGNEREESADDEEVRQEKRKFREQVAQQGKKYLLEVNPNYHNRSTRDRSNVIDARWIDTSTGLFIDITTVHRAIKPATPPFRTQGSVAANPTKQEVTHPVQTDENNDEETQDDTILYTKDTHAFRSSHIFPLRLTTFESIPIHIPFDYETLLVQEYGSDSLTVTLFNDYTFDAAKHAWYARKEDEKIDWVKINAMWIGKGGGGEVEEEKIKAWGRYRPGGSGFMRWRSVEDGGTENVWSTEWEEEEEEKKKKKKK